MGATFTVQHEFDCDEDTFWEKVQFNAELNQRLYQEVLKFPAWKVLEQNDDGKKITRRVHIDPPVGNLPAPVKKAMGDKFSYVEEGTYDRATRRYAFKVIPSVMPDKTRSTGELWTEKRGDKTVRHAKVDVEVKVFMVGGMVEEKIIADLKHSYAEAASFITRHLQSLKA